MRLTVEERDRREGAVASACHSIEMEGGRVDPAIRADLDSYAAGGLTIEEGLDRVRQRVVAAAGMTRSGDSG